MNTILSDIKQPIESELERFELMLRKTAVCDYPVLGPVTDKLLNLEGKRMRPILTLLTAAMHGPITDLHLAAAVIMELTHNASLVHDDVLDEAYSRRGKPTLLALMRSKGAVLAGDYLLTKGVSLGVKYGNYRAVDVAARTLGQLVEGELQQMKHATLLDTTQEDYYSIIRLKTAYLLASSAELGAPQEKAEQMYRFGELIGEAFQIQDDILDITGNQTGKAQFNDIREHKITLPLLIAFEQNPDQKPAIIKAMRMAADDPKELHKVVDFVTNSSAVEYCADIINQKQQQALQIIEPYPDSAAKTALKKYAEFVTTRTF